MQNLINNNPIGLFDSGIGGTSIWKEIVSLLPQEETIFLADSKNAPYGIRSKQDIIDLCIKNTEFLLAKNCKLIVIACNTATTNAIDYLRKTYNVPFIGIEPAIKPAALKSKTKSIGILATQGTLASELFSQTSELYASDINVIEQNGDGIVHLVETGRLYSQEMIDLLTKYLTPMIKQNIDYLVLGCTHYPYLLPLIKTIVPYSVTVIDSGEAVAKQTEQILTINNLLGQHLNPTHTVYSNNDAELLNKFLPHKRLSINSSFLDF